MCSCAPPTFGSSASCCPSTNSHRSTSLPFNFCLDLSKYTLYFHCSNLTKIVLILIFTVFPMLQVVLMLLLAVRLRWITPRLDISRSFVLRVAITVFTIVLVYSVAQANAVSF